MNTVPAIPVSIPLDEPVPGFLYKDIVSKLAYLDPTVQSAEIGEGGREIVLFLSTAPAAQAEIERKVRHLVEAMADGAFEPDLKVAIDHMDRPVPFAENPMPALLERGDVVQEGPGYFVMGPMPTRFVNWIENRILSIADDFNAAPYRFPSLISPEYLEKVKYFSNFPHSLGFVTHLREDLDVIEAFSQTACCTHGVLADQQDAMADIQAMLAPTICHHLYLALAGKTLPPEGLCATADGHCFRYESINMAALERTWNFTMREIIFVGDDDMVAKNLIKVQERIVALLDELGMAYRVENANDPFFIGSFRDQAAYQNAFELKYEIRALLPYNGETVAVSSFNRHKDFFGRILDIKLHDGAAANTGCFGMGFERIAFAFLAQFGLDPEIWPAPAQRALEMPLTGGA